MPNIACRVATPNSGPKIPNLPNKVKTKQMGALLVAIDVLSTRISFFLKLDKMAKLWAKTLCPNMGATAKFHSFWPMTWSNINIFQSGYLYLKLGLKYTSQSISSPITTKMWIVDQKNSQKWTIKVFLWLSWNLCV